jgi:hypothetical protein
MPDLSKPTTGPRFKRNKVTGKPDSRGIDKATSSRMDKLMGVMTFAEISTTIA